MGTLFVPTRSVMASTRYSRGHCVPTLRALKSRPNGRSYKGALFIGKDAVVGRNEAAPAHPCAPRHLGILPVAQRIAPHGGRFPDCAALHPGYMDQMITAGATLLRVR